MILLNIEEEGDNAINLLKRVLKLCRDLKISELYQKGKEILRRVDEYRNLQGDLEKRNMVFEIKSQ